MRSFEIFVEPERPRSMAHGNKVEGAPHAPAPGRSSGRGPGGAHPNEVLDLFIHGANVTARVAERHASCVLRDLAMALTELAASARGKRIVRFYDDAWELCVERVGGMATLSVYRGGSEPTVVVYDRPVVFSEMCASVLDAIDATIARQGARPTPIARELADGRLALASATGTPASTDAESDLTATLAQPVSIDIERDAPISFAAEFAMRPGVPEGTAEVGVERADLHALLVRGRISAEVRGRSLELGEAYPFLFAERLLDLSRRSLDAWERGQSFYARMEAGGIMLGLRSNADDDLPRAALTLSRELVADAVPSSRPPDSASPRSGRGTTTFPELSLFDVVESALAFGRALIRAIVRRDRSQGANLRLAAFRRDLRAASDSLRDVRRQDARINPAPESYRAFALGRRARMSRSPESPPLAAAARLRYSQRWQALVPGIDLRATFLCGDRIVIGAASETFCLERTTGELLWRRSTQRAASVVTPAGIARIGADGAIALHDFATGDVTLRAWISPRVAGPCAGAVVSTPGLPRLLIVTEGERHLVAIDLTSGEARWRYLWASSGRSSGALRLKRTGKLLYVASGDSALTAVDVQTGAVVWRARDRLRFVAAPTVDHESLFAIAGGSSSAAALHAIDPFSGRIAWTARLLSTPNSVEGPPLLATSSVCVAVRARRGLRLAAFHRETGAQLFETETPVAPIGTSWLAVDDLLVGNTPTGELVGVDSTTGAIRYRHVFCRTVESDVPRRLEPVLRSGALFVPHVDVHVFRPSDGTHLAQIGPCDAIPDLLRVDERCDVYVAEESGHMAAFGVGPRLSIVK
jgi:outer membrane protein assembly factor BamB